MWLETTPRFLYYLFFLTLNNFKMSYKFKTFGFKTVVINNFPVYTCNISVDRLLENDTPLIDGVWIINSSKLLKSGKEKECTNFSYVTTSHELHCNMQKNIMLFLEQHALRKHIAKYAYLHDQQWSPEMDIAMQHSSVHDLDF